jgi:TonB family protein
MIFNQKKMIMEDIKKKLRIGKFWSLGIAAAFMFFLTETNAQEYSKESMSDTQEEKVTEGSEYHNLDYRQENNEDFGKEEKLVDDQAQKAKKDTTDQSRQQYGLNQEIIEDTPTREELKQTAEAYKKYQDAVYGIAAYQIEYPDMMFDYEYNKKGELEGVIITGIDDQVDKDKASEWLIQAHKLSDSLKYRKDENGVYYQTEERARFKEGRQELYQELRGNLSYPDDAEDAGIEGVVQLRFIVDRFGNVQHIEAEEDIEGGDWIVDQMVEEAKNAFKRIDHDWIPGEIHNIEVPQWVTIPVHFSIKLPPSLQLML